VPHHLIDIVEPWDRYQAARFRADALAAIEAIRWGGRLPVVVGGTGLYIRALLRGLDPAAPRDPEFRREALALAETEGPRALHARLAAVAPEAARRLHPNDHVRIVRALELHRAGYAPPSADGRWREPDIAYRLLYVGLTRERRLLYATLRARAAAMVTRGLEEEVRRLLDRGVDPALPALQGIGYRQFVDVARGRLDPAQAVRLMQRETVRYAKRQWTWFAREGQIHWLNIDAAGGVDGAADAIAKLLEAEGLIE
jgi:tRNA dimethylallyltransferase